jgi:predicted transcriptional regulator
MYNDQILDPNTKILKTMIQQIDFYTKGTKPFSVLVNELDVGITALLESYADVSKQLRDEWRILEEVNALSLDEETMVPLNEYRDITEQALNRFISIANERINVG